MTQPNQVSLQIEEEAPADGVPRNTPNLRRLDSVSRPTNAHIGLTDRINTVFREIRPLVENARLGNNARLSLPTWIPRNQPIAAHQAESTLQRPQSSIAQVNLGPNAQTFIITERIVPSSSQNATIVSDASLSDQGEAPDVEGVNPASNNNTNDTENDNLSDEVSPQMVDLRATLHLLLRYAPFYLILLFKFMYDCREGLFMFCVLFFVFVHSNSLVRREHGKQMGRSVLVLFAEVIFTSCCIAIFHFLFGEGKLLPNVIMFPPYTESIDVWELIWLVCLTDLIVKIITVNVKMVVTMAPAVLLPFQKRGKVYLFVEAVSQLYRSLLTIQPWIFYLMKSYEGSEQIVGMFLTSVYVIAKTLEVLMRLRLFKNATRTLLESVNLGTKPTHEQLAAAGDSCPICHDEYTTPVRLGCSHIFCELCISAWLDREHTCPLCRAKVTDEPTWRDGTTTYELQLY